MGKMKAFMLCHAIALFAAGRFGAAPTASEAVRVEVSNKDLLSACLGFVSASQRGATPLKALFY